MEFKRVEKRKGQRSSLPGWESHDAVVEVKLKLKSYRDIRATILQLAYWAKENRSKQVYLLLIEPGITRNRLIEEWARAMLVFRTSMADRMWIGTYRDDKLSWLSRELPEEIKEQLNQICLEETPRNVSLLPRPDYSGEILKLLIYHWILTSGQTSRWIRQFTQTIQYPEGLISDTLTSAFLADAVGCTYRPVSNALVNIGSALLRHSDQSMKLNYFPRYAWEKLLVLSDKSRMTMRFVDNSGQRRSPESLLKRLRSLKRQDIGAGGVFGARYIYPDIDLLGTPRLDLTLHCPGKLADISFIRQLDPALKKQESKNISASLVIHFLRRNKSYFKIDKDGSVWADPVECLLDLQEARLESQALEFRNAIVPEEEQR